MRTKLPPPFFKLYNRRESFYYLFLVWNCVHSNILYALCNGKGINKEGNLLDMLVDRREHNDQMGREMNHNESSVGNIFHWSVIAHLMLKGGSFRIQ